MKVAQMKVRTPNLFGGERMLLEPLHHLFAEQCLNVVVVVVIPKLFCWWLQRFARYDHQREAQRWAVDVDQGHARFLDFGRRFEELASSVGWEGAVSTPEIGHIGREPLFEGGYIASAWRQIRAGNGSQRHRWLGAASGHFQRVLGREISDGPDFTVVHARVPSPG